MLSLKAHTLTPSQSELECLWGKSDVYLRFLRAGRLQVPVKDFLDNIWKKAGDDDDEDGKPGRSAGKQLNKDEVHVLCVKKRPNRGENFN